MDSVTRCIALTFTEYCAILFLMTVRKGGFLLPFIAYDCYFLTSFQAGFKLPLVSLVNGSHAKAIKGTLTERRMQAPSFRYGVNTSPSVAWPSLFCGKLNEQYLHRPKTLEIVKQYVKSQKYA